MLLQGGLSGEGKEVAVQCFALRLLADFTLMYQHCVGVLLKRDTDLATKEVRRAGGRACRPKGRFRLDGGGTGDDMSAPLLLPPLERVCGGVGVCMEGGTHTETLRHQAGTASGTERLVLSGRW
mgnify:FL=1